MSDVNELQTRWAAALFMELEAEPFSADQHRLALRTQRLGQLLQAAQQRAGAADWKAEAARLNAPPVISHFGKLVR